METITYEDFARVELRVGTIEKIEAFARARNPSFKVWVNFGAEFGVRQTSAQITALYDENSLVGKQIIGCLNLPPKNIAGFISEFLLVGFSNAHQHIALAEVVLGVPNGGKLH